MKRTSWCILLGPSLTQFTREDDMDQIFCLMRSGLPLTEAAGIFLMDQACELSRADKKKDYFMTEHFEGMISTEGKYASLGYSRGTIFTAVIESQQGKTTVKFIADVAFIKRVFDENLPWHTNVGGKVVAQGKGRGDAQRYGNA